MVRQVESWRIIGTLMLVMLVLVSSAEGEQPGQKQAEPATPEAAARLLDLRTVTRPDGAIVIIRSLGTLMYSAPGDVKEAFEFHRHDLTKRGFQELPGRSTQADGESSLFTKDGFHVALSASRVSGNPALAGRSEVVLVNEGNVALGQLPVPPGVKTFGISPREASYTTAANPTETAAACRQLLLAAGWEPYGETKQPHPLQPDASMQFFKRNAIKLQSWIMTTPVEGGKTLIRYSAELLSADLPAPPEAVDPRYDDLAKTLRFEASDAQTAAILTFYQERLPQQGWRATTERPIVDENRRTQFLVFRNSRHDLLALDLSAYTGKVEVRLRHKSAAQVAAEEEQAKAEAEVARQKLAEKNKKIQVSVPLPPGAQGLEKKNAREWEFSLPIGSGPATLEMYREHFRQAGWTETKGRDFSKTSGSLQFEKEGDEMRVGYFDSGIRVAYIMLDGSERIALALASGIREPSGEATTAPPPVPDAPTKRPVPMKRPSTRKTVP